MISFLRFLEEVPELTRAFLDFVAALVGAADSGVEGGFAGVQADGAAVSQDDFGGGAVDPECFFDVAKDEPGAVFPVGGSSSGAG